ncbi:MAG: P-II family nitrogen regulator [Candidatus Schekmanbacteria bacterium]|nr:P-II family nitrogen regulator [Candidatus Schekmanbacteria bacterium]
MKMIRAIIRPSKEEEVLRALDKAGFPAMTKMHVFGRGKQRGLQVGPILYDELPKLLLMLVVEDPDAEIVVKTIENAARTGNIGDGKIFISQVSEAYTVRTGEKTL